MSVAAGIISCLVSSWMMSHLGRNPVKGGSPARESKVKSSIAFSEGTLAHIVIRVDSFTTLIEFRVRKTVAVIIVYR